MANPQNLEAHQFKQGEARAAEAGRLGGIASGAAKRERRTLREIAEAMRDITPPEQARQIGGVNCFTYGEAAVAAMYAEAAAGNVKAFRALVETLGEIQTAPQMDIVAPLILGTIPQADVDAAKAAKARRMEEAARERATH